MPSTVLHGCATAPFGMVTKNTTQEIKNAILTIKNVTCSRKTYLDLILHNSFLEAPEFYFLMLKILVWIMMVT